MYDKRKEKEVYENKKFLIECTDGHIGMELKGLSVFDVNMIFENTKKEIEKNYDKNNYFDFMGFFDYYKNLTIRLNEKTKKLNSLIKEICNSRVIDYNEETEKTIIQLHIERLKILVEFDIYDYLVTMNNQEVLERNKGNLSNLKFYSGK